MIVSEVFPKTQFLNMSKVRHVSRFNWNNYLAFLPPGALEILIRWSPRIGPLVKTGHTISQHGESEAWLKFQLCSFLWRSLPPQRKNECQGEFQDVANDRHRIHSEWQSGKWMNVGRNLVAPLLLLRKRFTIGCHLIHSTENASDLIGVHWSQQSVWIHTQGVAMAMAKTWI